MARPEKHDQHETHDGARGPLAYATDYHAPVLSNVVTEHLVTRPGGLYVDATLGGGGHAAALLDALAPEGRVLGLDQDADALRAAGARLADARAAGRFQSVRGNFGALEQLLEGETFGGEDALPLDARPLDGLLLDLGVSSHQLDAPARGFSFQSDGPLDMRMDARGGLTAAQIVNGWSEDALKQLFYDYGEERRAPQIARALARARPLETTGALAAAVRQAVPTRGEVKTLARVFQALRIAVNGELRALEQALEAAPRVLRPGGRIAVISYHSLEDRRVKRFLKYGNFENRPVRDLYGNLLAPWTEVAGGLLRATDEEITSNPRARSARLRIAERKADV